MLEEPHLRKGKARTRQRAAAWSCRAILRMMLCASFEKNPENDKRPCLFSFRQV